ncbi:PKD domain-containing protein [Succinimonas sp.]|uniref:PKD domain-containing protein n=1 Tax=Succinimonas sp. TaxID=1936151 RepID=UPI003869F75D
MLKFNKLTVAMLSAIALTACGGGGGSGSSSNNNPDPVNPDPFNPDAAVQSYVLPVQVNTEADSVRGGNSAAAVRVQQLNDVESQGSDDALMVCIDSNGDSKCDSEPVKSAVNAAGKADLKWTDADLDLKTVVDPKIISVQKKGEDLVSVMEFSFDAMASPSIVNNVHTYQKLFLNPLSSTQSRAGGVQQFKNLIGCLDDDECATVQDFAYADPANLNDSFKALLDILYQEGMTYSKVIKANGLEHTITGNYEKITGYLKNNNHEGARITLVTEVMTAIAKGEPDPFANLGSGEVAPDNHIPNADFNHSESDLTVTFTDLSTDTDEDILSYTWSFGDGQTSSDQNPSHTYAKAGSYDVSLMVSDGSLSNYISQTVTVSAGGDNPAAENTPPVASFSYKADKLKVTFTNTSTDVDGDLLSSVWSFGDGKPVVANSASSLTYTFAKAGTYKVTLTVDDGIEAVSKSQDVTVSDSGTVNPDHPDNPDNPDVPVNPGDNNPPVAAFDAVASGLTVNLTNTSSDADQADTLTYKWDFGDGNTSDEASPSHTYSQAGTYKIVLVVSDGKVSKETSRTVEVKKVDPDDPEALKCTLN